MLTPAHRLHRYRYSDYLALEETSNVKHEFVDGEIYAMAGGTPEHAALAANVSAALHASVAEGPCRVYSSDLRVRVLATGLAAYADVTVVCGPLERDPDSRTTVVNPTLLVEVLSDGTEDYDHGEKLEHYQQIPSLRAVLLVSHRARRVWLWSRDEHGVWGCDERTDGDLEVGAIGARIGLGAIYAGVVQAG